MLKYVGVFHPQFQNKIKNLRRRIIGSTVEGSLLFLANTQQHTSIEMVSSDGRSTTVISFNKYMDLINANLSPDKELIHFTERIPSGNDFLFKSMIYNIHDFCKSKEFSANVPIDAMFVPNVQKSPYQLMHLIGNQLTHLLITTKKHDIRIDKYRCGLHLKGVMYWKIDRERELLWAILDNRSSFCFCEFSYKGFPNSANINVPISVSKFAELPDEVSLSPKVHVHSQYFRVSKYNFFVGKYKSNYGIVQQLFEGPDSCCGFSLYSYPSQFKRDIMVHGVEADLFLNCLIFESIIFVFIPNEFIYLIDLAQSPPNISSLPKSYSNGFCSHCAATIPLKNHIVDIDSYDIYSISIDFSHYQVLAPLMNRTSYDAFAQICARLLKSDLLCSVFWLLENINDFRNASIFIRDFFRYCKIKYTKRKKTQNKKHKIGSLNSIDIPEIIDQSQLTEKSIPQQYQDHLYEIECEFPSTTEVSRRHYFRHLTKKIYSNKDAKSIDEAAKKAINYLDQQNEIVLVIRDALDQWQKNYNKSQLWLLFIKFIIQTEAYFLQFPCIPCLKEELEAHSHDICSSTLCYMFSAQYVTNNNIDPSIERNNRYMELFQTSPTSTDSSISWASSKYSTLSRLNSSNQFLYSSEASGFDSSIGNIAFKN